LANHQYFCTKIHEYGIAWGNMELSDKGTHTNADLLSTIIFNKFIYNFCELE